MSNKLEKGLFLATRVTRRRLLSVFIVGGTALVAKYSPNNYSGRQPAQEIGSPIDRTPDQLTTREFIEDFDAIFEDAVKNGRVQSSDIVRNSSSDGFNGNIILPLKTRDITLSKGETDKNYDPVTGEPLDGTGLRREYRVVKITDYKSPASDAEIIRVSEYEFIGQTPKTLIYEGGVNDFTKPNGRKDLTPQDLFRLSSEVRSAYQEVINRIPVLKHTDVKRA